MAWPIEREPKPKLPEGVQERPEEVGEIPRYLEQGGVRKRPVQFTAQVKQGKQQLIQTAQTQVVSIQLPADQGQLVSWSKGSVSDSLTWLGQFWLRMIKKAIHFGWRIIRKVK